MSTNQYFKAIKLSLLPPNQLKCVQVNGKEVLLANINGEIFSVSKLCTHEEADLCGGTLIGDTIVCPLHESEFSLRTGQAFSPPAEKPLQTFEVKIEDGFIWVQA